MVPTIRTVRTEDPEGYVKGVITMFEVVDLFNDDLPDPISSHYTERDAEDKILELIY